jgi:hypothetical protein
MQNGKQTTESMKRKPKKYQQFKIPLPDGTTFITCDKNMLGGVLTKKDEELLNPPPGTQYNPQTFESIMQLSEGAKSLQKKTEENVLSRMNKGRAAFVKTIRVHQKYSWRMVALRCFAEWQGNWNPPDNQIVGMMICERASEILNEDVD